MTGSASLLAPGSWGWASARPGLERVGRRCRLNRGSGVLARRRGTGLCGLLRRPSFAWPGTETGKVAIAYGPVRFSHLPGVGRNQGCGTCEAPGPWRPRGLLGGLGADPGKPLWLSLARCAGLRFCSQPAFGAALPRRAKENAGGIHRRSVSGENPGEDWRIDRSSSGSFAS